MRTRIPVLLLGLIAASASGTTAQAPSDSVETVIIARSWRISRIEPTAFCAESHAGFPGTTAEDLYSFRSVAVAPDGRITDADVQEIGRITACFAPLPDGKFNFFARGFIGTTPFAGRGVCETLDTDSPEPGLLSQRCFLRLSQMPPPYVGGLLTTNTINSRSLIGGTSDPPGYTQPSIATIRLWRSKALGSRCALGWTCPRPLSDAAMMAAAAAFDSSSQALRLGPLRTTKLRPDQFEIRWWSRGYVNAVTGTSQMMRLSGSGDSVRATRYVMWGLENERLHDSLSWRDTTGRRYRESMTFWNRCERVERRPPVRVCHVRLSAADARAMLMAFERNGGWDLRDQSEAEPRHMTLDGAGFLVEVVRNGRYRNYGYDNPDGVGYGMWARADSLRTAWACAAGVRTENCP